VAETNEFVSTLAQLNLAPTIAEFNRKLAKICEAEFARTRALEGLDDEQKEALQRMLKSMVKKIAHDPIKLLQEQHRSGNGFEYADMLRRLFNLQDESDDTPEG
jgi:glutamyl-tRNA reductase